MSARARARRASMCVCVCVCVCVRACVRASPSRCVSHNTEADKLFLFPERKIRKLIDNNNNNF